MSISHRTSYPVLVGAMLLIALPWQIGSYQTDLLTQALLYAILAISVDLLWGYTGILNLAPAAFFGLGAYAFAMAQARLPADWGALAGLLLALAVPVLATLIIGYASFKAKSTQIYFALITLAVGLGLGKAAMFFTGLTGGSNGLTGVLHPSFWGFSLYEPRLYYYFVLTVAVLTLWASHRLVRSPLGHVLQAVRENEQRAGAVGYNTLTYKLIIFSITGAMAGLAGALSTPLASMAHPSQFSILLSMQAYVWVAVGGQGTLSGPFLGAIGIKLLESWLSGVSATTYLLALGVLFVLVVLFIPGGMWGAAARWRQSRGSTFRTGDHKVGVNGP